MGAGQWVSHVTPFAVLMQPATGFARLIRRSPDLDAYAGFADRVEDYVRAALLEFEMDTCKVPETGETWYWRPLGDHYEPTNHMHLLGETLLDMYAMTQDPFFADRIRSFLRTFERSVRIDEDGFVAWKDHPHFTHTNWGFLRHETSEPVWKACLTVPFLYAAKADGFAVDPDVLGAVSRTIRDHVVANNDIAGSLHPEGSVPLVDKQKNTKPKARAHPSCVFCFLAAGEDCPEIVERIRTVVSTRHDLFPDGWLKPARKLVASPGPLGYAYMMQREGARSGTQSPQVRSAEPAQIT